MKSEYWKVPEMWKGATVYILGGAPSLLDEKLELIEDKKVIGVNCAFLLGDWVDIVWFGDPPWFDWNEEKLAEFGGLKACCCEKMRFDQPAIKVLERGKKMGLEDGKNYRTRISWNWSSGGSAVNLATLLGASKVVLLGFDMKPDDKGRNWWHNLHKNKLDLSVRDPYPMYMESFEHIAEDAKTLGVEIVNSTMCSIIPEDWIPKRPLEEVVSEV